MAAGKNDSNEKPRTPSAQDDGILAGDSAPPPRWHLTAATVVWGGWLLFMIGMAVHRVVMDPR